MDKTNVTLGIITIVLATISLIHPMIDNKLNDVNLDIQVIPNTANTVPVDDIVRTIYNDTGYLSLTADFIRDRDVDSLRSLKTRFSPDDAWIIERIYYQNTTDGLSQKIIISNIGNEQAHDVTTQIFGQYNFKIIDYTCPEIMSSEQITKKHGKEYRIVQPDLSGQLPCEITINSVGESGVKEVIVTAKDALPAVWPKDEIQQYTNLSFMFQIFGYISIILVIIIVLNIIRLRRKHNLKYNRSIGSSSDNPDSSHSNSPDEFDSSLENKHNEGLNQNIGTAIDKIDKIPILEKRVDELEKIIEGMKYQNTIVPEQIIELSSKVVDMSKLDENDKKLLLENEKASTIEHNLKTSVHFFNVKDYETCLKILDLVFDEDPNNLDALHNKGVILLMQNKNNQSLSTFKKVLEKKPNFINSLIGKGICLRRKNQYQNALDIYDKILNLEPNNAIALSSKGVAYGHLEQYDDAIRYYDMALSINPEMVEAISSKAISLFHKNQKEEALSLLEDAISKYPNHLGPLVNKGFILLEEKKNKEAQEIFEKILEKNPEHVPALNNMANLLIQELNYVKSIELLEKALNIDPDYIPAKSNMAFALSMTGKLEESNKLLDDVLNVQPWKIEVYYLKLTNLLELENYSEAHIVCKQILKKDPKDVTALRCLAKIYMATKRFADAIKTCDKLLKIKDNNIMALMTKGDALHALKKNKSSLECYNTVTMLDSVNYDALFFKACLLAEDKKIDEVIELLEIAVKNKNEIKTQVANFSVFDYLRSNPKFKKLLE